MVGFFYDIFHQNIKHGNKPHQNTPWKRILLRLSTRVSRSVDIHSDMLMSRIGCVGIETHSHRQNIRFSRENSPAKDRKLSTSFIYATRVTFPNRIRWKFLCVRECESEKMGEIKSFFTRLRHSNGCRPLFTHIHPNANKSCKEAVICTALAPIAASRNSEKMTTKTTATTIVRRMIVLWAKL